MRWKHERSAESVYTHNLELAPIRAWTWFCGFLQIRLHPATWQAEEPKDETSLALNQQVHELISRVNNKFWITCRQMHSYVLSRCLRGLSRHGSARNESCFLFPKCGRVERFLKIPKATNQEPTRVKSLISAVNDLCFYHPTCRDGTNICQVSRSVWKHSRFKVEETWNHKAHKKMLWCWAYFRPAFWSCFAPLLNVDQQAIDVRPEKVLAGTDLLQERSRSLAFYLSSCFQHAFFMVLHDMISSRSRYYSSWSSDIFSVST